MNNVLNLKQKITPSLHTISTETLIMDNSFLQSNPVDCKYNLIKCKICQGFPNVIFLITCLPAEESTSFYQQMVFTKEKWLLSSADRLTHNDG